MVNHGTADSSQNSGFPPAPVQFLDAATLDIRSLSRRSVFGPEARIRYMVPEKNDGPEDSAVSARPMQVTKIIRHAMARSSLGICSAIVGGFDSRLGLVR